MNPSYLDNVSFATVTMAVNSLQPTLLCVIKLCVCLYSLYDQDIPFLEFFVLSVIVVVAPTQADLGRGFGRTWLLAIEPPKHTHTHNLGGDPWQFFCRDPETHNPQESPFRKG